MNNDRRLQLFTLITGVFVTALVVGDIIGGKLIEVRLLGELRVISVGMIPFPVTFLFTDILNEFYGKKAARFVTIVGFCAALFAFLTIAIAASLPWAGFTAEPGYKGMVEGSFNNVFTGSQRILVASMVAYVVGQFLDINVFNLLKRLSSNRHLWLRATGSTLVSQLVDTFIIQVIAWTGTLTPQKLVELVFTAYIIKILAAVGLTPLIYAGHTVVERVLGIEPLLLDPNGEPLNLPPDEPGRGAPGG